MQDQTIKSPEDALKALSATMLAQIMIGVLYMSSNPMRENMSRPEKEAASKELFAKIEKSNLEAATKILGDLEVFFKGENQPIQERGLQAMAGITGLETILLKAIVPIREAVIKAEQEIHREIGKSRFDKVA